MRCGRESGGPGEGLAAAESRPIFRPAPLGMLQSCHTPRHRSEWKTRLSRNLVRQDGRLGGKPELRARAESLLWNITNFLLGSWAAKGFSQPLTTVYLLPCPMASQG